MKKILFCLIIILFGFSCSKQEGEYLYPAYILVGQNSGKGIHYVQSNDTICDRDCYPGQILSLDLNSDNVYDFDFKYEMSNPYMQSYGYSKFVIIPLGNNSVCVSNSNNTWVDSLLYNDTIDYNRNWLDSIALFSSYNWTIYDYTNIEGYWFHTNNYYIGVKIDMEDYQLYGWIEKKGLVIKRYAITEPYLK
jgi:hypothetical protein